MILPTVMRPKSHRPSVRRERTRFRSSGPKGHIPVELRYRIYSSKNILRALSAAKNCPSVPNLLELIEVIQNSKKISEYIKCGTPAGHLLSIIESSVEETVGRLVAKNKQNSRIEKFMDNIPSLVEKQEKCFGMLSMEKKHERLNLSSGSRKHIRNRLQNYVNSVPNNYIEWKEIPQKNNISNDALSILEVFYVNRKVSFEYKLNSNDILRICNKDISTLSLYESLTKLSLVGYVTAQSTDPVVYSITKMGLHCYECVSASRKYYLKSKPVNVNH